MISCHLLRASSGTGQVRPARRHPAADRPPGMPFSDLINMTRLFGGSFYVLTGLAAIVC